MALILTQTDFLIAKYMLMSSKACNKNC